MLGKTKVGSKKALTVWIYLLEYRMQKFLILSALFLLSCSGKDKTVYFQPISDQRTQAVQDSLLSGKTPEDSKASVDCQAFIKTLPNDYFHDFLEVPENWSQADSPMIKVFYYGRITTGKDVVVFYNGGPASDSHGSYQGLSEQPRYNEFSFIFMDQRGTGCSTPYPQDYTTEGVARLLQYSSRAIVMDSEALRKKLLPVGKTWKVFGQSFGGRIVQRYLQVAPEGLTSAHAHGYSVMSDDYQWLALRLLSQHRVFQDYLKIYPKDDAKILKIRAQIKEDQCFVSGETSVCGPRVIDSLILSLGFKSSWGSLHLRLSGLIDQNDHLNLYSLNKLVEDFVFGVFAHNYAAGTIITWADFFTDQPDLQFCHRPLEILRQKGEHPDTWALNECRLLADIHDSKWDPLMLEFLKTHQGYADPIPLDKIKENLKLYPKLKFFLYSGQADVFVPLETFEEEINFLAPLVRYTNFPNSGHEGFLTEEKVWQDLAN